MCDQEEKRLKHKKPQSVHMATHDIEKTKRGKNVPHFKKDNKLSIKENDNKDTCFFCKKKAYMKKDCQKYQRLLEKKCNSMSLVCHESFFC
jgi:hypothetical protein